MMKNRNVLTLTLPFQNINFAGDICIDENQSVLDHFTDIDPNVDFPEEEKTIISQIMNMTKENVSVVGTNFKKGR